MTARKATEEDRKAIELRAREPMAFFPHDSTAASDIKCRRLLRRFGLEGYGRWWLLCETLAATHGHSLPAETEEDYLILADALRFGGGSFSELQAADDCRQFVQALLEIGLVRKTEDGGIASDRMLDNAAYFGRQRHNGGKGGRPPKKGGDAK